MSLRSGSKSHLKTNTKERMMQLEQAQRIYLPGRGAYDVPVMQLHRAVEKYDDRLAFGRNQDNGQWCVFVKMPRGHKPPYVPVLGFSTNELPTVEEVLRRVEAADTRRFSKELLKLVTDDYLDQQKRVEKQGEDLNELFVEIFDYAYRKQGAHPVPRIIVPRGI
jgi:hypothetical protein